MALTIANNKASVLFLGAKSSAQHMESWLISEH